LTDEESIKGGHYDHCWAGVTVNKSLTFFCDFRKSPHPLWSTYRGIINGRLMVRGLTSSLNCIDNDIL